MTRRRGRSASPPTSKVAATRTVKRTVTRTVTPKAAKVKAPASPPSTARPPASRWARFVEAHGVVLASASGPVPSLAATVAGGPIRGSWWAHPRAHAIFAALSTLDDRDDVRCFKLVDKKLTFVHRRLWPALVRLAEARVLDAEQVAAIAQEHMPSGEHRNVITPFPAWVPADVTAAARELTVDDARAQLGGWVDAAPRRRR